MSLFAKLVVHGLPLVPKAVVGRVAQRYVAGETLEDGLRVAERLRGEGAMTTFDVLGESVAERERALHAVDENLRTLEALAGRGLDVNVSVKPTLIGLLIDEAFCLANLERLVAAARAHGGFVRIDMEDRSTTDATLRMYRELHARHGGAVGVVLQAYMRRTLSDVAALPVRNANVRICKGIYIEPRAAAWKGYDTVRLGFLAALEKLLGQGAYVGIATHDEFLVAGAVALLDRLRVARDRYEFQMLHGVDEELRRILIAGGHRLRVYVPYGRDWYPYSVRRLRENPEVARHVVRALLRRPAVASARA
jgi:proline dehydrogenase